MGALELSNQRQNCFKGNTGETAEKNRMEWARASKSTVYMYLKVSNWTVTECEAGWEYYILQTLQTESNLKNQVFSLLWPCGGVQQMQKLRTPMVGAKGYERFLIYISS